MSDDTTTPAAVAELAPGQRFNSFPVCTPATEAVRLPQAPGALQKKARVLQKLQTIPKRGRHEQQNFSYMKGEDLIAAVRPLLAAEGLLPSFVLDDLQPVQHETQKGPRTYLRVHVRCALVDCDTGDEIDVGIWCAESNDGEKAVAAATAMAVTLYLSTVLLVDAADDGQAQARRPQRQDQGEAERPRRQAQQKDDPRRALYQRTKDLLDLGHTSYDELTKLAHENGYKGDLWKDAAPEIHAKVLDIIEARRRGEVTP